MHVHGGPVLWTVYLHGKVLGGQGGRGGGMEACATCRRVRGTAPWMLVKK